MKRFDTVQPTVARSTARPPGRPGAFLQTRRILVPIDFSSHSQSAIAYAVPIARHFGAAITLLYVVTLPHYGGGEYGDRYYGTAETDLRKSGQTELRRMIAEIRSEVRTRDVIRTGDPAWEIIQFAKSWKADLIIISTHGRTGLKRVCLGSVSENVVRRAPCPVLVLPVQ